MIYFTSINKFSAHNSFDMMTTRQRANDTIYTRYINNVGAMVFRVSDHNHNTSTNQRKSNSCTRYVFNYYLSSRSPSLINGVLGTQQYPTMRWSYKFRSFFAYVLIRVIGNPFHHRQKRVGPRSSSERERGAIRITFFFKYGKKMGV